MDHPRHQRETKYSKDFAAEPRYAQVRGVRPPLIIIALENEKQCCYSLCPFVPLR